MPDRERVEVPERVVTRLDQDIDQLTPVTVSRVFEELSSYATVEPEALAVSVRRNLTIAVRALRSGRPPVAAELVEAEVTTRERFARGIPVEEIIRAFRISIGLIQERFVAICFAEQIPAHATLAGSRATAVTSGPLISASRPTPTGSCAARSRRTFPSNSRPGSNSF